MKPNLLVTAALLMSLSVTAVAEEEVATPAEKQTTLQTITILGSSEELERTTGSAHRVEEDTLEEYQYDDINRVLNFVPGVYLREEDGFGLRPNIGLRGGSSDRSQKVTLMEDGVLIAPAPYSAPAAYYFPAVNRMVGVEVFKGPSAIQHGPQTVGGAINLISAPIPDRPSAMLDAAIGSFGYGRVHARGGTAWDRYGLSAEYVHSQSDGFKELDGGGDTGFVKNDLLLKNSIRFDAGTLEMRLGYADEVSDETYLGLTEADFRNDPLRRYRASRFDRMEWEWYGGRLDWTQPAFGGDLRLTGYTHRLDRDWRKFNNLRGADIRDVLANPDSPNNQVFYETLTGQRDSDPNVDADDLLIGTNAREIVALGVQGNQSWSFDTGTQGQFSHLLEVGLRLHQDRIRRDHDEFAFEMIAGIPRRKSNTRAITADNTGFSEAVALWIRDEILFDRWTIAPGVRIEAIATEFTDRLNGLRVDDSYTEVLPGLGVNYAWSESLTLLGGVHKGFSPATPGRNAGVEPEEAVNWEFGGRLDSRYGRFELIYFFSDYSNLTAVCTFSAGCGNANLDQQINAGEVQIGGIEAGWNHELALVNGWRVPVAVTYTFTESAFQESFQSANPQFDNVQKGFELPYVPQHRANAAIGLAAVRWGANLSLTYQSEMRDEAGRGSIPSGSGADDYTVLDLAAYYDLTPALSLTGRIDNLLDEEYVVARRPFGARPGKPQSVQVGLKYEY